MQKDYWPFVLLVFAAVLSLTVFRTPVERAGEEPAAAVSSGEPAAGETAPAVPPSSGPHRPVNPSDAPLTEREQKEIRIRLSPDGCNSIVRKANQLAGIDDNDKRKLIGTVTCLRRGNVAWAKCVDHASTKDDLGSCSRRLLIE